MNQHLSLLKKHPINTLTGKVTALITLLLLIPTAAIATFSITTNNPDDLPFVCDPSLYMVQGVSGTGGPAMRNLIKLDSNLINSPVNLGASNSASPNQTFSASNMSVINAPITINGVSHSFADSAIYAISQHNSESHNQGQHIYRIYRNPTGGVTLYDLQGPVNVFTQSSSINPSDPIPMDLAGRYTGGTMILWDDLNLRLLASRDSTGSSISSVLNHSSTANMESLMVVTTMNKGTDDFTDNSNNIKPWGNHLYILAVEKSHIGNGTPNIIAGPIMIMKPNNTQLTGLYDIAYDPVQHKIYGHIPGNIIEIDLSANTTSLSVNSDGAWQVTASLTPINLTPTPAYPTPPSLIAVGSAYFNGTGNLLLYGGDASGNQRHLYAVDISNTNATTYNVNAIAGPDGPFGASDGTSCAFAPRFTKSVSPSSADPGDTVTYTFTIENNQASDFTVDFSDSFDVNLTVISATIGNATYTTAPEIISPNVNILNIVVAAHSSVTLTIAAVVNNLLVSSTCQQETLTVQNQASLTGVSGFPAGTLLSDEPNISGFEDQTPLNIVIPPLNILKEALNTPWQSGATGTFLITVNIPADIPANQSLAIQDVLPTGFSMIGSPTLTPVSAGWSCNSATGICYLNGPITAGTTVTVSFDVQTPGQCGTLTNNADVGITNAYAPSGHPIWPRFISQCQSSVNIEVTGCCNSAALNIEKTHKPPVFSNGGVGEISITVNNTGSSTIFAPIQVVDSLPAGLSMLAGPFSPNPDVACVAGPPQPSPQVITCAYMGSEINTGGSFNFDFQVNVNSPANAVVNNASVFKGCCGNGANDTTSDSIPIDNQKPGTICGHKYLLTTTHPVSNWSLTATTNTSALTYTATTNNNGEYCMNVPPGTYTVNELLLPGWSAISPTSASYTGIVVASGVIVSGIDFINRHAQKLPSKEPTLHGGGLSISKKHSPSRFQIGSKGAFMIKVKNKGPKLEAGVLTVVDHMPPGLSVKTGSFKANSWLCTGSEISSSGQDVTCSYNRKLNKNGHATLRLNATVAAKGIFPDDVKEVKNCAIASLQDTISIETCDTVKITHKKSRGLFGLPFSIPLRIGTGGGAVHPK